MTTRSVLIAAAAVAVIASASACGTSSTTGASSSEAITTPPATSTSATTTTPSSTAAATPTSCTELDGTVANQVCTVHTVTPTYTIDMKFPTDYPDQDAVVDVLKRQRDQFIAFVEEPPVRAVAHELDITGTTYRSPGTESLVFEEYVDSGGAHPETYYETLNYDLGKKAPITYDTLFVSDSDPVAVLDPILKADWQKRLDGDAVDDNPTGAKMYENFALQDDAVVFYIGQGMWAFEAAGPQSFSIPRSELTSILA